MDTHGAQTRLSHKYLSRTISGKEDYFHNFQYVEFIVLITSVNFLFGFKCLSFSDTQNLASAARCHVNITFILYVFQILFGNTCRLGCVYEALYQKLCKKLEYCFIFLVTHLIERCHHETQLSTQTKVIFILHFMR